MEEDNYPEDQLFDLCEMGGRIISESKNSVLKVKKVTSLTERK